MKTKTSLTRKSISRSPSRRGYLLKTIALALACFALAPQARAVCQDGCFTNSSTALGESALQNNTGSQNTAVGWVALAANTTGSFNTAVGYAALADNVTGGGNTAVGDGALEVNTTGSSNTAVGNDALFGNTTGIFNTATGVGVMQNNSTGSNNTACGFFAAQLNRLGSGNTAIGFEALRSNKRGINNTALGTNSLYNCVADNNTALGISAGMNIKTGSNDISIGNVGVADESNTIRMGNETHTNTFIAGISGVTVPGGIGVIVDSSGHLGTTTSSARYKEAIQPMDKASEAVLALKPVTFRYNHELDPDGIQQFGLVAEQVEQINPALVAHDQKGKPYSVRYEAVNAMLLNEFLKEHRKVEEQEKRIDALTAQLKEQAALIQKVSDKVETNKPAPQIVLNNQ
jgi:hypothetical protein